MNKHEKRRLTLYAQLQGAGYYDALMSFHFAEKYHTGTRKDGTTPEFAHQIEIGLFAMLLPDVRFREELLCTIALHDIREDFGVADSEIRALFLDPIRANLVANAVHAMTKKYRGAVRAAAELFDEMAADSIASLAKLCDRQHNLGSMVGVFTQEKQRHYIAEVKEFFLPMLKKAKRNFPFQIRAYELMKFNLMSQIDLIEASLDNTENTRAA
jgi:(p)ppGpp synthase/HD superfamily hydrolase